MNYYSLQHKSPPVSFKEALLKGIAPDKGLYFPEEIKVLPSSFFNEIDKLDIIEIAYQAIKQFIGNEIPKEDLKGILKDVLSFDFPLITIEDNISVLELFHGPTMAFKDVGARFMARCLEYFTKTTNDEVTILVATSGDTGGAVAKGFLGVKGVKVVILYPSGKVTDIQEKQLTTLGENITALEVSGAFDDCQEMVKKAFLDKDITNSIQLTSANSINIARWLPQLLYYFIAYKELKHKNKKLVFSVPSGNFGNICAGIVAQKLGLPIHHFIAATNSNDTIVNYLSTGKYLPQQSVSTISNAMDVGNPSNFVRIEALYENDIKTLKKHFSSYSFSDFSTKEIMKDIYAKTNYIMEPHGAIGYLGLQKYGLDNDEYGIFLETAHPIKFLPVVEETLNQSLTIPEQIASIMKKDKKAFEIKNYDELKDFLLKQM